MGIIRVAKTDNYTVMSNYHLRDKSLTLKAKGLLSLMLSLPDDWDYSIAGLVTQVKEGRTAVTSALDELIENNYVIREAVRKNGRISDWNYTVYEMPTEFVLPSENLKVENLIVENQVVENMQQLNTDINKIKNNKIKNNKSTGTGALTKHPRNFSKERLVDDLKSGEIIDEQKKEKKKISEYDKCLAEIDNRYEDPNVYMSLVNHLEWSYNSKDPKRIKSAKIYSKRLDELDKLTGDKVKIVQQSIDKQWHCFYELQTTEKRYGNTIDNSVIKGQTLSREEAKQRLAEYAERNGVI